MKKYLIGITIVIIAAWSGAWYQKSQEPVQVEVSNNVEAFLAPAEAQSPVDTINTEDRVISDDEATDEDTIEDKPDNESVSLPVIDEEVEELTDLTDETNSRIVAAKTLLSVPFIVQAPFAKWELPYKEACEEASILMLHQYKLGVNELSEDQMIELIDDVIAWETDQYGDRIHSSSDDTLLYLTELYGHDEESVSVIRNFTIEDMKAILDSGYPILVPAAGRDLGNENFRDPGPLYHMLVVIGYNQTEFITNDPGTRNGARYRYDQQVLFDAIHDLTDNVEDITEGEKAMIVLK